MEEFVLEEYEGELPHPEILERFNQVVPGSAEVIFDEMTLNAAHRRKQENRVTWVNTVAFGFSVVATHVAELGALAFGGYLILNQMPMEGFVILVGQVALLRWGKKG